MGKSWPGTGYLIKLYREEVNRVLFEGSVQLLPLEGEGNHHAAY
jgi:hypothetical protein